MKRQIIMTVCMDSGLRNRIDRFRRSRGMVYGYLSRSSVIRQLLLAGLAAFEQEIVGEEVHLKNRSSVVGMSVL